METPGLDPGGERVVFVRVSLRTLLLVLALGAAAPSYAFAQPLTTASVQHAVNQALDWTRKSGAVLVKGIQEIPSQNEAIADLRFDDFRYNASGFNHEPRAKNEATPAGDPAVVYIPPSAERHVASYAGGGSATLKHYNDGRWVLSEVHFNSLYVTGNIQITRNVAPTTLRTSKGSPTEAAQAFLEAVANRKFTEARRLVSSQGKTNHTQQSAEQFQKSFSESTIKKYKGAKVASEDIAPDGKTAILRIAFLDGDEWTWTFDHEADGWKLRS